MCRSRGPRAAAADGSALRVRTTDISSRWPPAALLLATTISWHIIAIRRWDYPHSLFSI